MSLYSKFKSIKNISYYGDIKYNPIEKPENSWNFIEQYFKFGGKEYVFDLSWSDNLKKNGKHIHTISMYYLGCILNKLVENRLNSNLEELVPGFGKDFNYKFIYSWFLTCLYHDSAWVIEDTKIDYYDYRGASSYFLDNELKRHDVKWNVYSHKWIGNKHYTYSKDLIQKYFYYCFDSRNKIDHGIIGGFILYDRLTKNYNNKWEECRKLGRGLDQTKENFKFQNLSWKIEHLDHFAYVSNAIIAHNIWYSPKGGEELYKKYGLEKLIKSTDNKVTLDEEPLIYFLAIVDTIEPTKFFYTIEPKHIWTNIDMEYNNINKQIEIKVLDENLDLDLWFKKIRSLEDWLAVKIEQNKINREIIIKCIG